MRVPAQSATWQADNSEPTVPVAFFEQKNAGLAAPRSRDLQQSLLDFFLTADTVLGPRYRFQSLLLHFFLTIRTQAVFVGLDALQCLVNHVQDGAVGIGHTEEEL